MTEKTFTKHVLYLSYDGMTDPLGQSQVLPYLIGLSKKGYVFTLISFEKQDRFEKDKAVIQKICDDSNIDWKPQFYTKKPPVLSTLKDIWKMNRLAKINHIEKPFDIIHCRSYISALIGLGFKRKHGVKFLFDMRGFWADERVEGKIWNLKNPLFKWVYSYFKKKEKQFFSESDGIVSLTHAGKKIILDWKLPHVTDDKIAVIPCCVDLKLFDPTQIQKDKQHELKINLKLENKFVVGYIGSIGTWYMLDEMLATFKEILTQNENAVFLFVTRENQETILNSAKKLNLNESNFRFSSCVHSEVPLYISLFDCSIFYIRPSFSKQASSPTKQGELMAMGIPIICNSGVGDTTEVIQKYHSGVIDLKENFMQEISVFFDREKTINGANNYFDLRKGIQEYEKKYLVL
jgi:glycosyltransferase involved in cell wall biosynthesis